MSLDIIFARYPYPPKDMVEHLKRNARALGLPFGDRTMTYNSRLAQELGAWAQEEGNGDGFHGAAFRSYFVDGQNLAEHDVLLGIAEKSGLDRSEAEQVITSRSHAAKVDRDWEQAGTLGITAVPTFVIGGDMLVGAQEYRSLAAFAEKHGARKKK